jgi:hypothetical protein
LLLVEISAARAGQTRAEFVRRLIGAGTSDVRAEAFRMACDAHVAAKDDLDELQLNALRSLARK